MLNPARMLTFLEEKLRSLGTSACPPYHLAIVVGGTSAEYALKTAKYASAKYLDTLPASGWPDRARLPRPRAGAAGARADPPASASAPSSAASTSATTCGSSGCPGTARPARSPSRCPARPTARPSARSPRTACSWSSWRPTRPSTCPTPPTTSWTATCVRIDLARPMSEIRAELSRYPIKTRLALTGPMVVARDIAHAKIAERLAAGEPMPDYLRDHAGVLRRPGQDPRGLRVRLLRPDHRGPDGLLRRSVPGRRRLAGHAGQGQPLGRRDQRLPASTAASTSAPSAAPPPGWPRTASPRSRCWSTPSWAWRRSGGSRSATSRPSSWSTTRATTSSPTSRRPSQPLLTIGSGPR